MDLRENVRTLARITIPATEFQAGCIFSIDPGLMMLLPQLEIGKSRREEFKPVDYSLVSSQSNIVAVAYQGDEVVSGFRVESDKAAVITLAGAFGRSQRMGVLYLEAPFVEGAQAEMTRLTHFKALCFALNDCLNLK